MNLTAIRSLIGSVIVLVGLALAAPLIFAAVTGEPTVVAFAVPMGLSLAVGWLLRWRNARRVRTLDGSPGGVHTASPVGEDDIGIHEGVIVVVSAWCSASLIGAVPFLLSGALTNPIDALFESISGLTTTSATVFTDVETQPGSILVWRALLNWLGGLGIVVLFVSIFPRLGMGGNQLFRTEMSNVASEKLRPRIRETAKLLWGLYVGLTVTAALLLWAVGVPLFDAVLHALSTVSTGGFSTRNAGIAALANPMAEWVLIVFMFLGATNFALLYRTIRRGEARALLLNREFQTFGAVALGAALLVAFYLLAEGSADLGMGVGSGSVVGAESGLAMDAGSGAGTGQVIEAEIATETGSTGGSGPANSGFWDVLRLSLFHVVSLITTTGVAAADYTEWPSLAGMLLFALMFVSGMSGSTSGGPKMIRILIAAKHGFHGIIRLLHPRSVIQMRLGDLKVPDPLTMAVGSFLFLYFFAFAASSVILSLAGLDVITTASMAIASLGNIGPAFGDLGPFDNYAFLPNWVKLYLSFLMLLGRLEMYSLLVLFLPAFWTRK